MIDSSDIAGATMPELVRDLVRDCSAQTAEHPVDLDGVRRCAIEARRIGLRPETLLIALREAWHDLPAAPNDGPERYDVRLTRLVHTVLQAYFGDDLASGPVAASVAALAPKQN